MMMTGITQKFFVHACTTFPSKVFNFPDFSQWKVF
jgi:hypothetical protein